MRPGLKKTENVFHFILNESDVSCMAAGIVTCGTIVLI
jgi:hypothetical protein